MGFRSPFYSSSAAALLCLYLIAGCGKEGDSLAVSPENRTGPVDAATSSMVASATSVSADGVTYSTITVTLKDSGSHLIVNKAVTLRTSRGSSNDAITAVNSTSDSSGKAVFRVTSTVGGATTVSATAGGIPLGTTIGLTFSNAAILSNLALWLRADTIGAANNSAVSSWTDDSGNGYTATQSTGASQPIYKTNAIGAHAAVEFDGSNDYLSTSLVIATPPYTMLVVYDYNGACGAGNPHRAISGSSNWLIGPYDGKGNVFFGASFATTAGCLTAGTYVLDAVTVTGSNSTATGSYYENGAYVNGVSDAYSPSTISIGGRGGTEGLGGRLVEVLIYTSALSSSERQSVESYLNAKYSIY